jgi:hypothetical protein
MITLKAQLNGGAPMTFMLDTGATMTSIPQDIATRIGAREIRRAQITYGDGSKGLEPIVIIPKLSVVCNGGTVFLQDVEASRCAHADRQELPRSVLELRDQQQAGPAGPAQVVRRVIQ